jgi:hypothetical protein
MTNRSASPASSSRALCSRLFAVVGRRSSPFVRDIDTHRPISVLGMPSVCPTSRGELARGAVTLSLAVGLQAVGELSNERPTCLLRHPAPVLDCVHSGVLSALCLVACRATRRAEHDAAVTCADSLRICPQLSRRLRCSYDVQARSSDGPSPRRQQGCQGLCLDSILRPCVALCRLATTCLKFVLSPAARSHRALARRWTPSRPAEGIDARRIQAKRTPSHCTGGTIQITHSLRIDPIA